MSAPANEIPQKYDPTETEGRWRSRWDEWGIHAWDPERPREETFVVDTPPLTVSGSLHVGHSFSYTQADLIVRFQRMRGRNIAYPIGWDDNGLPTERRVQNVFGVRCNPRLPYDPEWRPTRIEGKPPKQAREISRRNFTEACALVTAEDEKSFEEIWRRLGLSVDWSLLYETINEDCRKTSQLSFLDLFEKGAIYQTEAPTMWDIDFRTAVAQAEMEDRERPGAFHDVRFGVSSAGGSDGGGAIDGELVISTTRPELLGACVAVVAHPDDDRYAGLFGKTAVTPLYHAPVPIRASEHADPEKGTGILMVCTFGDIADVEYWRGSGLPQRPLVGLDGRLRSVDFAAAPFASREPARANAAYSEIEGLTVAQARKKVAEQLAADGSAVDGTGAALVGEPRPITHPVKFYEQGDRPLELVSTRQWFVRLLEHREEFLAQGRKVEWHPAHMRVRYEHWVEGLNQDWCISRQRFSGVPFPVWYPLDAEGNADYERPILAKPDALPVDPLADSPPGYTEEQRGAPNGFTGDPDVMDTWATSSMTPQIVSRWRFDPERHARLFPGDLRPQAHEIIRTWAFYTIVKAWLHDGEIPWKHAAISGWILDPDRKKMSKSVGNVVTPGAILDEFSVDAFRYWAGRARLGTDTAYDPQVLRVGRRLATKVFNASRFVLGQLDRIGDAAYALGPDAVSDPLDRAFAARLCETIERATRSLEQLEYAPALAATEELFWTFCDDYLELVKIRSYGEEDGPERRSALATLQLALRAFVKLLAPFLPYVTEEVWSWRFARDGRRRSVHTSAWPTREDVGPAAGADAAPFVCAVEVLRKIRSAKTRSKRSLRWPVESLVLGADAASRTALEAVVGDVLAAGAVPADAVRWSDAAPPEDERFAVDVTLADKSD